jgi:broad specificity phosphatase PhoE
MSLCCVKGSACFWKDERKMTTLFLIRHGSTAVNEGGALQGAHQVGLSPLGRQQIGAVAAWLHDKPIAAIHASPLPRAAESAAIIAHRTGAPVHYTPALVERDYGHYDGHTLAEVVALRAAVGVSSIDPLHDWEGVPGVESDAVVWARVSRFLIPLLEAHQDDERALAVVTHSGVIQACLYGALGVPAERKLAFRIPRGMFSVWEWGHALLTLRAFYPDPFELKTR